MECIASFLGLPIVSLTARHAVSASCCLKNEIETKPIVMKKKRPIIHHRSSVEILLDEATTNIMMQCLSVDEDDETVSTTSLTLNDSFGNDESSSSTVTFAQPLVTAIYSRPATLPEDKHALYYCDRDFRQFRREYMHRKRTCLVKFPSSSVVTEIHEYPSPECSDSLYYSESDLQQFLNEFVASLNGCSP